MRQHCVLHWVVARSRPLQARIQDFIQGDFLKGKVMQNGEIFQIELEGAYWDKVLDKIHDNNRSRKFKLFFFILGQILMWQIDFSGYRCFSIKGNKIVVLFSRSIPPVTTSSPLCRLWIHRVWSSLIPEKQHYRFLYKIVGSSSTYRFLGLNEVFPIQ